MLLVKVYMLPNGLPDGKRLLTQATITCTGVREDGRTYKARLFKDVQFGGPDDGVVEARVRPLPKRQVWRTVTIRGHQPGRRGVWDVLGAVLREALGTRLDDYTPDTVTAAELARSLDRIAAAVGFDPLSSDEPLEGLVEAVQVACQGE